MKRSPILCRKSALSSQENDYQHGLENTLLFITSENQDLFG